MTAAQANHVITHGSGEQLLLLAILGGCRFKPAIDRELQRRAYGEPEPQTGLGRPPRAA